MERREYCLYPGSDVTKLTIVSHTEAPRLPKARIDEGAQSFQHGMQTRPKSGYSAGLRPGTMELSEGSPGVTSRSDADSPILPEASAAADAPPSAKPELTEAHVEALIEARAEEIVQRVLGSRGKITTGEAVPIEIQVSRLHPCL